MRMTGEPLLGPRWHPALANCTPCPVHLTIAFFLHAYCPAVFPPDNHIRHPCSPFPLPCFLLPARFFA